MIRDICEGCQIFKQKVGPPRSLKLTIGTADLRFNNTEQIDTMFIYALPVRHLVDQTTHVCIYIFFINHSSSHVWQCIEHWWSQVYRAPLDFLHVYQGTNYRSLESR